MNIRELKQRWRRRQRKRKRKAIGLDSQNNNFALTSDHHAFLYISLPSLHEHDVKLPYFHVLCIQRELRTTNFHFLFLNSETDLQNLTPEKFVIMWQIERLKKKANSFFEWRCRSRGLRFCLSSLLKNYKRTIAINGNLQLKIKNNCPEHPAKFA